MAAKCLGTGTYTAQIRALGSGKLVEEIEPKEIFSGSWNRLNRATSKAELSLPLTGSFQEKCCKFVDIGKGIPAYQLYLWRLVDGLPKQLVWKGVLTAVDLTPGNLINISAQDNSWWLSKRRGMTRTFTNVDTNEIAKEVIQDALAINNPANLVVNYLNSGVLGSKEFKEEDGGKILSEVSGLVEDNSYWTCILDEMRIGLSCDIPWTFTDSDISETPPLNWDADFFATEVFGRTSGTSFGVAGGIDSTRFGIPILIQDVLDASSDDTTEATQAAAKFLADSQSVGPRLEALSSAIVPQVEVDIMTLIPGCRVKVNFEEYCDPIATYLYLTQTEVSWGADEEDVRIELSPNFSNRNAGRVASV